MAGFGYAALCFLNPRINLDTKYVLPAVRLLFLLWLWIGIQSIFNYWDGSRFSVFNVTLFQNIILFWLLSSQFIRTPSVLKNAFLSFILSVFMMSVLIYLGIGVERDLSEGIGNSRLSFFGNNSNTLGEYLSISIILVVYLFINRMKYFGKKSYWLLFTIPVFLSLVGLTGSRGALVIIIVGISVLFFTIKSTFFQKIIGLFIGSLLLIYIVNKALESEVMQKRVVESYEDGNLGGREIIWARALNIFYYHPFTGLGATGYEREVLKVSNRFQDTHNLYLYLLVTGGIVGLCIYLIFFYVVWNSAWTSYSRHSDSIALILLFIYLFSSMKSGGFINDKFMWFLLAVIYSSKYGRYKK